MSDHYTDDGCGLYGVEALSLLKIGLMSEGELHPDFRAPVPSDRGLILVALSQEDANETARILASKFEELLSDSPEAPRTTLGQHDRIP